jgi:Alpha-N-acetylglucosaminidase (NAGLU) tim-barrel domain/Alpha-N-acetylglucosaminidase (NAGLU) C-terminal domain
VYESMRSTDPDAIWVLQGWFLYNQADFWKPPQALLGAVPDDRLVALDLWGDRHPVWQKREAFYGKPWIWNVLYNFGGKVSLTLWGTGCTEGQNDDLNLYAHKQWQGMFTDYYLPRWQAFFARLDASLETGTKCGRAPFVAASCRWEQQWSNRRDLYPTSPRGDSVAVARRLLAKYRHQLSSPSYGAAPGTAPAGTR